MNAHRVQSAILLIAALPSVTTKLQRLERHRSRLSCRVKMPLVAIWVLFNAEREYLPFFFFYSLSWSEDREGRTMLA
jgi:hypothetical protein